MIALLDAPIIFTDPANEKLVGEREKSTVELSTLMMFAEGNLKFGARGIVKKSTTHNLQVISDALGPSPRRNITNETTHATINPKKINVKAFFVNQRTPQSPRWSRTNSFHLTLRFSFCSSRRTRRVPIWVSSFCHLQRQEVSIERFRDHELDCGGGTYSGPKAGTVINSTPLTSFALTSNLAFPSGLLFQPPPPP